MIPKQVQSAITGACACTVFLALLCTFILMVTIGTLITITSYTVASYSEVIVVTNTSVYCKEGMVPVYLLRSGHRTIEMINHS